MRFIVSTVTVMLGIYYHCLKSQKWSANFLRVNQLVSTNSGTITSYLGLFQLFHDVAHNLETVTKFKTDTIYFKNPYIYFAVKASTLMYSVRLLMSDMLSFFF